MSIQFIRKQINENFKCEYFVKQQISIIGAIIKCIIKILTHCKKYTFFQKYSYNL